MGCVFVFFLFATTFLSASNVGMMSKHSQLLELVMIMMATLSRMSLMMMMVSMKAITVAVMSTHDVSDENRFFFRQ